VRCLADRFRGAAPATLIVVFAVCILVPGAAVAGTLDQQQTDASGNGDGIASTQSLAQIFTAGLSGELDQVDLELSKVATITEPLNVEIRNVSGGKPGISILAGQGVPGSSVPASHAFVPISFASPAAVVAGTQYAIVAWSNNNAGVGFYAWHDGSGNTYAAGDPCITIGPPSGTWDCGGFPFADLAFKSYVVPSNAFTLGAVTRNKTKGTATLNVNVPNPGDLTASGNGAKVAGVAGAVTSKAVGAGNAQLLIKAKGKKKKKLNQKGKVKLNVAVTYTPTGGEPSTQSIKVKLKKKL
jgi:hypothetical protein